MKHLWTCLAGLALLLSCAETNLDPAEPADPPAATPDPGGPTADPAAPAAPIAVDVAPEHQAALVKDNTAFALELHRALAEGRDNLFFSPASISTALAMTYAGARGQTAEQMATALHLGLPPERLHPAFAGLANDLLTGDQAYELAIANRLWGNQGTVFEEPFLATTRDHYGAGMVTLDFGRDPDGSRTTINDWVAEQTRDKIVDLIPPGVITSLTRLVLTNAIYFKGTWSSQFDPKDTEDKPFYRANGNTAPVPLMSQEGTFHYLEQPGEFQLLALPYEGDRLQMVVLLPTARDGLAALEQSLTAEDLDGWIAAAREQKVQVWLPRFKLTSQAMLTDTMKQLGMIDAFDPEAADFTGMAAQPPLHVSAIVHKAFVDVNEEGTEAAAATAVVMATESVSAPPPRFRADHEFLFLIRDAKTGTILFMGRLTDPAS